MAWLPLTNEAISEYTSGIDVDEQIDLIREYIQGHIDMAADLLRSGHDASQVEIIAFSILDTLGSLAVSGRERKGGGTRLRMFIEQHGGCPELLNYSVPALLEAIDLAACDQLHELRDHCQILFEQHWEPGCMPELNLDLCEDEAERLAGSLGIPIRESPKVDLDQCKHSRMLASKRNAIVHQLVRKGLRSTYRSSSPHYIWCADDEGRNLPGRWDLVYPANFLLKLCRNGQDSTCAYLREKRASPYSILAKSSPWLADK